MNCDNIPLKKWVLSTVVSLKLEPTVHRRIKLSIRDQKQHAQKNKNNSYYHSGFSLIELMIVVAIIGIIAVIAFPSYEDHKQKTNNAIAVSDIQEIAAKLEGHLVFNNKYPETLAELNLQRKDPWGNDYHYLNIPSQGKSKGKLRKDKNLVPINSHFDLYSAGKDGKTNTPLTAKASRDDIIWANDGNYVGIAEDF